MSSTQGHPHVYACTAYPHHNAIFLLMNIFQALMYTSYTLHSHSQNACDKGATVFSIQEKGPKIKQTRLKLSTCTVWVRPQDITIDHIVPILLLLLLLFAFCDIYRKIKMTSYLRELLEHGFPPNVLEGGAGEPAQRAHRQPLLTENNRFLKCKLESKRNHDFRFPRKPQWFAFSAYRYRKEQYNKYKI